MNRGRRFLLRLDLSAPDVRETLTPLELDAQARERDLLLIPVGRFHEVYEVAPHPDLLRRWRREAGEEFARRAQDAESRRRSLPARLRHAERAVPFAYVCFRRGLIDGLTVVRVEAMLAKLKREQWHTQRIVRERAQTTESGT